MAIKVEHCKQLFEFFVKMNNSKAVLQYRVLPNRILDFQHTEVPVAQQGKGVAKLLVLEGFRYAAANDFKVRPSCPYVGRFVKEQASEEQKKITVPTEDASHCSLKR